MSKFVPFNGKGLFHYNHVDKGYLCSFCTKSFGSFDQYEEHWPKCTGVCTERPFKPFEQPTYPKFPSSFATAKSADTKSAKPKPADSKPAESNPAAAVAATAPKETKAGDAPANPKNNNNNNKKNKKG